MTSAALLRAFGCWTCLAAPSAFAAQQAPPPNPFFDGDQVHIVHLTFAQPNWFALLTQNFEGHPDPLYAPAAFDWDGQHLDTIGVRFKGASSYWSYPGVKKSFKLDINEYVSGQRIAGLKKLNLNNVFHDPSFVREKLFYELAADMGLCAPRASFAALYVNDVYFGLYTLVEQVDDEFVESRFGADEHGNLWKGEPHGSLEWQGTNPLDYQDDYSLETNETQNDWSALIDLCDRLNHTHQVQIPTALEPVLDVNANLGYLALCNLTGTIDSYLGRMRNGYFYRRDVDGRFVTIPWDANESFGARSMNLTTTELAQLDTHWLLPPADRHPLANRLWDNAEWNRVYHGHMRRSLARAADPRHLVPRMHALHDLVRPWVRGDANKMYTNAQFEGALLQDIDVGIGGVVPALETFVVDRSAFLATAIGGTPPLDGVVLNEIASVNGGQVQDEVGQSDPWVEVVNAGASSVDLVGLRLETALVGAPVFVFPSHVLAPGARVLVWCDGSPAQGPLHAPFTIGAGAVTLHLLAGDSVIDVVHAPVLSSSESFARIPDAVGNFKKVIAPSPGAVNAFPDPPHVQVNEFMASNTHTLADEAGEFEDWVELYNGTFSSVDLTGWHLTDDLQNPTKWTFPPAMIAAGGHLLVWCDNEPSDGPLHATFKLSDSGEAVGLSGPTSSGNAWVDTHVFGAQVHDVSEGRTPDGGALWSAFAMPTPLAPNAAPTPTPHAIPYGVGKLTSSSRLPALAWEGTPSVTANDFRVRVVDAQPNSLGLLFAGPGRAEVPFSGGTRWVSGPLVRLPIHALDANGRTDYAIPLVAALVGTTRCYQFWFRDVAQHDGTGTGLSGALEVDFGP